MVHDGNTSNPSIRDSESVAAWYVRTCVHVYIGRATSGIGSDSIHTALFGNRVVPVFFLFFFFLLFSRPTRVALSPFPPPFPPPLTNAYREYVGNFDAHRSPRCRHSRCCENPIEVGTRHEDISKIFVDGATRSAKNTKNVPFHSLRQFRSFVRAHRRSSPPMNVKNTFEKKEKRKRKKENDFEEEEEKRDRSLRRDREN